MYCKNCGCEINENAAVCTGCGFANGVGDKFCGHCGNPVLPGQSLCLNCGFMIDNVAIASPVSSSASAKNVKEYEKYKDRVAVVNKLSLSKNIISIILLLALIFLPIYICKYEPDLDEIENFEEFGQALDKGYLEKSFSLFDDLIIIFNQLTSSVYDLEYLVSVMFAMFPVFEFVFSIITIVTMISKTIKALNESKDLDNSTMLIYNQIKKSGNNNKKENLFHKQSVISIIMFAVMDIFMCKVFGIIYREYLGLENTRNMTDLIKISPLGIVVIMLIIAYFIINIFLKNKEKEIIIDITQAEYNH